MTKKSFLRSRWFEDIPVGEFHVFGSYTFSEQELIEFGELYAPQVYHTEAGAGQPRWFGAVMAGSAKH